MTPTPVQRWVRAGLACGITDFLWACGQTKFMNGGSITRLWQGVAAAPFGASMFDRGATGVLLGIACHFAVAFTWAGIFVFFLSCRRFIKPATQSAAGTVLVAAIYGPLIWTTMSWAVIPLMTHKLPSLTVRWFIQLAGHVPFVGLPIVFAWRDRS